MPLHMTLSRCASDRKITSALFCPWIPRSARTVRVLPSPWQFQLRIFIAGGDPPRRRSTRVYLRNLLPTGAAELLPAVPLVTLLSKDENLDKARKEKTIHGTSHNKDLRRDKKPSTTA